MQGPWGASTIQCTVYLVRIGKIVHLGITSSTGSSTSNSNSVSVTATLPSRFFPSITEWYCPMIIVNGGNYVCGNLTAVSGGTISIYSSGNVNYSGTCGITYSTTSWMIE